jgi:hypothetical protein
MAAREAACSCGQLKIVVEGEPSRVSACHCLACQRRTGSAFGVQARFPRATFSFCPQCGATVYYIAASAQSLWPFSSARSLDPSFPPPRFSVWEDRKHAWVTMPPDIERMR